MALWERMPKEARSLEIQTHQVPWQALISTQARVLRDVIRITESLEGKLILIKTNSY